MSTREEDRSHEAGPSPSTGNPKVDGGPEPDGPGARLHRETIDQIGDEHSPLETGQPAHKALAELAHIYSSIPVGLCFLDTDLRYVRVNERLAAINGKPIAEHIGRTIREVIPDLAPQLERLCRSVLDSRRPVASFEVEGSTTTIPPLTRSWEVSCHPMRAADGELLGISCAVLDITERKRLQRIAEATNALFQLFIRKRTKKDYLDAVAALLRDLSGCRCVGLRMLNGQGQIPYEATIGFGPEFVQSECWLSVGRDRCACTRVIAGTPEAYDRPAMTEAGAFCCNDMKEFVAGLTPEARSAYRGVCVTKGFCSVAVVPIRYRDTPLGAVHLADERPGMVSSDTVGFIESMTPLVGEAMYRFNIEGALREQTNILEAFFRHSLTPLVVLDRQFDFVRVNEAYGKACERDVSEFPGHNHFEFYPHAENEAIFAEVVRTRRPYQAAGKPFVFPDHPEWGVTYWDWTLVPILDASGEVEFLIFSLENVTERKLAEEKLKATNAALAQRTAQLRALASELTQTEQRERRRLAQVLHDHLQQLLVGAKFGLELLRREVKSKEQQQAVRHVADLLNESIEASRSLTCELSPPVLYEGGLAAALGWLGRWMREKHGLTVEVQADGDADPDAEEVAVLLFQAVRELLFNVVKHAGVESAEVRMGRTDAESVAIVVTDHGVGFDPAGLQNDVVSASRFGLFSIRERLDLLGGRLLVETAPGKGSRFTLVAPVQASSPAVEEPASVESAVATAPGAAPRPRPADRRDGKIRLLLVDDHRVMRQGLASLLSGEPDVVVVGEAPDGLTAVELTRTAAPDVIIMDVSMPGMNGPEATRIITAEHPHIRVIGLSMHEESSMAEQMLSAGAAAYLNKAGPLQALLAAIRGRDR